MNNNLNNNNNDMNEIPEMNERFQENKAFLKPQLTLTPSKILHEQAREHSSPEDSIGSETPPPVTNTLSYEPSSFNNNHTSSVEDHLQFNQKWIYEQTSADLEKPFKEPKTGPIEQAPLSAIIRKVGGTIEENPFNMWSSGIIFSSLRL